MKRVGVDIGGTFTDLVVYDEASGEVRKTKTPTTPSAPEEGLLRACELAEVDAAEVSYFMHATTLVTNLVLTRSGARVGLLTTKGFRDVLEIGTSYRRDLYDLQYDKPKPFVPRHLVYEVDERVDHKGNVLVALDPEEAKRQVGRLMEQGVEAIAVALFNSYANPEHERMVGEVVRGMWPEAHLSLSSEVDPRIREYPRVSTTVLNAYAMPRTRGYIERLDKALGVSVKYMHSGAGIVPSEQAGRFPITLVASGPAAGVLAGKFIGDKVGRQNLITIDAGGTSFDVGIIRDGEPDIKAEVEVEWGIPARTQSVDINSIGAGGGSIAWIDEGGALRVGPESAGAVPGPACYDQGGTRPTVTDANLVMGLLNPDNFLGGRLKIEPERSEESIRPIARHFGISLEEAALGIYRVVNAHMVQAIQAVTVRKGIDPRDFTMVSYGGAGGQHAFEVAKEVGVPTILVPAGPSTFSAFGLLTADLKNSVSRTLMWPVARFSVAELRRVLNGLEKSAKGFLKGERGNIVGTEVAYTLDVRYVGQSNEVAVSLDGGRPVTREAVYRAFEERHQRLYGTRLGDAAEIVNAQVTVTGLVQALEMQRGKGARKAAKAKAKEQRKTALYDGPVAVFDRGELENGMRVRGPCIVEEEDSAFFMPRGADATVDEYGNLLVNTNSARRAARR